ncbi:hypothetical protein [Vulcanococcus limneticus]|jgi:hypothetical protein|uniref:hypothetical protein n=1 Tax=Vulcanococcus limneticus TaxID=2170428 RepID=UPI00398BD242
MARPLPLALAIALAAALPLAGRPAHAAEGEMVAPATARPTGLVVLEERPTMAGPEVIGVFSVSRDPSDPAVRQIKVWLEKPNDLRVRTETLRCSPAAPMRITSNGRQFILRELNPGGIITPANRLDHQIWWAACFPEHAGKDPAGLAAVARQLGFSGQRQERQEVLPGNAR